MVFDNYLTNIPSLVSSFLYPPKPWQEVAKTMQQHRDATIAAVEPPVPDRPKQIPLNVTGLPRQLLSEREVQLTEMLPEQLVESLADGSLTSVEVTNAFLRRAGLAQKLVNASQKQKKKNCWAAEMKLTLLTPSSDWLRGLHRQTASRSCSRSERSSAQRSWTRTEKSTAR
jgi:hypothetical protein